MNKVKRVLIWIDELAPTPWLVDGVKQARPIKQIIILVILIASVLWVFAKV